MKTVWIPFVLIGVILLGFSVAAPLFAVISGPQYANAGQQVGFTCVGATVGMSVTFSINFGDGTSAVGTSQAGQYTFTHTYSTPNNYLVYCSNNENNQLASITIQIISVSTSTTTSGSTTITTSTTESGNTTVQYTSGTTTITSSTTSNSCTGSCFKIGSGSTNYEILAIGTALTAVGGVIYFVPSKMHR